MPTLNAEENVLLPAELSGAGRESRERAAELLERVGLHIAQSTIRFNFPVGNSSGSRWHARLLRAADSDGR